jgi:hypothetical protein
MDFMMTAERHPSVVDFGNCMNTITSIANNINPPSESARMGMELDAEPETMICCTTINPLGNSSLLNQHNITQGMNTSLNLTATCLESGSEKMIESRIHTKPWMNSLDLNGVLSAASTANATPTQLRHQRHLTRNSSIMNSSKIVLNTSANFSSIRIEKKGTFD